MDRFLIIRTSSLGDIIHGIPVAAAIKGHLPHSRISWIIEERFKDLLTGLPWVDGVKLIYKKFHSILESMGVEEVCALGEPFDPALHEAVAHMQGEEGKVINEVQKGYRLKDKLVRPSQVVVGKGNDEDSRE